MNYNFLTSVMQSPWQVDWNTFVQYNQVLRGVFQGLVFGEGKEPENVVPYLVSVGTGSGIGDETEKKFVQIILVRGIMLKHDMECGPRGMRTTGQRLLNGEKNENVVGSVLIIESGGGQSVAVPEIADAIRACEKPVVAFVDGLACSAAIYAASYCDEIYASRETDVVGSIGTMIAFEDFGKFVRDGDGMVHVRIYADGSENKNEEFETSLEGNFKVIREQILNPVNEQFKRDVKSNRPALKDEHLTGRTWTAKEMLGVLVDAVGSLQDAVNRVVELSRKNDDKKNIINMNKYPLISNVTGLGELASVDGHVSLSEEHLGSVESALQNANASKAKAETDLQNANAAKAKAETDLQNANSRIAVLEGALERKPGAEPANPKSETDGSQSSEETFYGRFSRIRKEFNY